MSYLFYFILVNTTLLFPGYVFLKKIKLFSDEEVTIVFSYIITIVAFAFLAVLYYIFGFSLNFLRLFSLILFSLTIYYFFRDKLYKGFDFKFPLLVFILFSTLAILFTSLPFKQPYTLIPDPTPMPERNYKVFTVKILNIAHTPANDNYVPFRQAQFFTNRMSINKESFIREWGVNFFFRTPLMGGVAAYYFDLTGEKLPRDYLWASNQAGFSKTYQEFQIIATILNSLFLLSGYILIKKIFNQKIASLSIILITINGYFLYNTFFSWPKLFVAYFILAAWYLLLYNRKILILALLSGLAYFAHDLAILYIFGIALYLLINKDFKNLIYYIVVTGLVISPWYFVSRVVYHQQSLFLYYPFFLHGLGNDTQKAINDFFSTPIIQILKIKLDYIYYLLSPYYLFYPDKDGLIKNFFLLTIFTLPGSIGLNLFAFSYFIVLKEIKKIWKIFVCFLIAPILLSVVLIGNPMGIIASLHYLEPIVVLLIGFGLWYLVRLSKILAVIIFLFGLIQYFAVFIFSYNFNFDGWNGHRPLITLSLMALIYIFLVLAFIFKIKTNESGGNKPMILKVV